MEQTKVVIFVFGSNEAGIHGAGAAAYAVKKHGAIMGQGEGLQGTSYAIPTKDRRLVSLPLNWVGEYITEFLSFAIQNQATYDFMVSQIGCGLAGFQPEDIAPMFLGAPLNCMFDEAWKRFLGVKFRYWGHVAK